MILPEILYDPKSSSNVPKETLSSGCLMRALRSFHAVKRNAAISGCLNSLTARLQAAATM